MRFSPATNLDLQRLTPFAVLLVLLSFNLGCEDGPDVVQHKVHKSRSGLEALRESKRPPLTLPPPQTSVATTKNRMVVAIFDNPDKTWFFKLIGPVDQVDAAQELWSAFFDSVKFEDGQPKWDAPEEWSDAGSRPMRFATLLISDSATESEPESKPLELAVSSLGPNQPMLLNANRWRGQLGLGKLTEDQLGEQLKTKTSEHGEYLLFDAQGTGSGTMRAPFAPFAGGGGAGAGAPPFVRSSPIGQRSTAANLDLKFSAPEGWSAGKTSTMVQARFLKSTGDAEAQITVIEMPANVNEWVPNVKRWADQVGLNELTDQQLTERTSDIKVDQVSGKLVDLVVDSDSEQGVIAAMVKRQGSAWFFKLSGEKELVDQSRKEFEAFMDSIRYQ